MKNLVIFTDRVLDIIELILINKSQIIVKFLTQSFIHILGVQSSENDLQVSKDNNKHK